MRTPPHLLPPSSADSLCTGVRSSQDFLDLVTYYRDMPNKPKVITMIPPPLSNFTCADMPVSCLLPPTQGR